MYLIMKLDQYDCNANRTPITITEDYKRWYYKNTPNYYFEVYNLNKDNSFNLVKDYEDIICEEYGMAFYRWEEGVDKERNTPYIIQKWENHTYNDTIPSEVLNWHDAHREDYYSHNTELTIERALQQFKGHGILIWVCYQDNTTYYYYYGEYIDNKYRYEEYDDEWFNKKYNVSD